MVGPRSTRYTYWPVRVAGALDGTLGRTVLLPGDLDRAVQYSDARSIAAWSVRMLAEGRGGTYNAVARAGRTPCARCSTRARSRRVRVRWRTSTPSSRRRA